MSMDFETWVQAVFMHPVYEQHWYWENKEDAQAASDAAEVLSIELQVEYVTRLFEKAGVLLADYLDQQVREGLWYLADTSFSNYMFAWQDASIDKHAQQRFAESFYSLFAECFAKRCSPHLSHKNEKGANPINGVCYMWWDILPIGAAPKQSAHADMDMQFLDVMQRTLQLNSIACQESALHGLGHWTMHYPEKVTGIIDGFIKSAGSANPSLLAYATHAKTGMVN